MVHSANLFILGAGFRDKMVNKMRFHSHGLLDKQDGQILNKNTLVNTHLPTEVKVI